MAISFAVLGAVVVLFVWNRLPVELVAIGAALTLYATGVLNLTDALAGFGDPTVLFIATLFVVSEGLDAGGSRPGSGGGSSAGPAAGSRGCWRCSCWSWPRPPPSSASTARSRRWSRSR
jgi:hypothetical protein